MRTPRWTPARPRTGASAPVVVGVDGSPPACAALRAAPAAAAERSAGPLVVSSYARDMDWLGGAGVVVPVVDDVRESSRRLAEDLVAEVRAQVPAAADVPVTGDATPGPPTAALVDLSARAQLVVRSARWSSGWATPTGPEVPWRAAAEAARMGAGPDVVVARRAPEHWGDLLSAAAPVRGETAAHARWRAETLVREVLGARPGVRVVVEEGAP